MSPSNSRKSPPVQEFSKYYFFKNQSSNISLVDVPLDRLKTPDFPVLNFISGDISLNFIFKFNEKKYNKINISNQGFLILREELDIESVSLLDYFNFSDSVIENDEWRLSNFLIKEQFDNSGVLVCPWFDSLSPVRKSETEPYGLIQSQEDVNFFEGLGAKYCHFHDKNGEECFLVRWRVFSGGYDESSAYLEKNLLRFEVILRSSGKIEFRYDSLDDKEINDQSLSTTNLESATIGIFVNDNGWNFRDMSDGLGHLGDSQREISNYGGFDYSVGYEDTAIGAGVEYACPYNISLISKNNTDGRKKNWPGNGVEKSQFFFNPPQRRRKVLPRVEVRKNDILSKKLTLFNDRKTLHYGEETKTHLPSGFLSMYGNGTDEAGLRQNLLGNVSFVSTLSRGTTNSFSKEVIQEYSGPFVESIIPETTSTNALEFESRFSSADKNKKTISINLSVEHKIDLHPTASSIYYYNSKQSGFFSPIAELTNPIDFILNERRPDDYFGFGPTGERYAKGGISDYELDITRPESSLGEPWSRSERGKFLNKRYPESLPLNEDLQAQHENLIHFPVQEPFLVEKIDLEIPMEAGPGWTNDRTTSGVVLGDFEEDGVSKGFSRKILDFAGPGLTVSLFKKSIEGLELVAKGTITHSNDIEKNISTRITWGKWLDDDSENACPKKVWIFEPEGFKSYGAEPSGVVVANENGEFSGRVRVSLLPETSAGAVVSSLVYFPRPLSGNTEQTPQAKSQFIVDFLKTKKYTPGAGDDVNCIVENSLKTVDVFGKSFDGNIVSCRSVLGNEIAPQTKDLEELDNPFYVADSFEDFPDALKEIVSEESDINAVFHSTHHLIDKKQSPFLIMPGDKFVLAVSKTRPALNSTSSFLNMPSSRFRHGNEHEIRFLPGNITVKLFGSNIKRFAEYNHTLGEAFYTKSITSPILTANQLDQFETNKTIEYAESYTDNFVLGSLIDLVRKSNPSLEEKRAFGRKIFSKLLVDRTTDPETYGDYERESIRIQPRSEFAGMQNFVKVSSKNERYYDSAMPQIEKILEIDGSELISVGSLSNVFPSGTLDNGKNYGVIFFNMPTGSAGLNTDGIVNNDWMWSFPFEEKYKSAPRVLSLNSRISSKREITAIFDFSTDNLIDSKKTIDHLIIGRRKKLPSGYRFNICLDIVDNKKVGLSNSDINKIIYGFGDDNTLNPDDMFGHNHQPVFRKNLNHTIAYGTKSIPGSLSISPKIRGWKYGAISGDPYFSSVVLRRGSYGQFRDMLEQRLFSKFVRLSDEGQHIETFDGPVSVKFVDYRENIIDPLKTDHQNITSDSSSALPYFDGEARSRPPVEPNNLGRTIVTLDI
jgi:hypothetical protein